MRNLTSRDWKIELVESDKILLYKKYEQRNQILYGIGLDSTDYCSSPLKKKNEDFF